MSDQKNKRVDVPKAFLAARDGLQAAFAMYSRFPSGKGEWSSGGLRCVFCFFPLVGAVLGMFYVAANALVRNLGGNLLTRAVVLTILPLLVTGGIHMDGFLDTADARASWQSREKKLEILKDSHTGAFALIVGAVYLLAYLAVAGELRETAFPAVAAVFVLERVLSAWSVIHLPKARPEGLAGTFAAGADDRLVSVPLILWGAAACLLLLVSAGWPAGGCTVAAALLVYIWYRHMALREFGGVTGDLAGYFLQLCELAMLAVLAIFG
ncbi:MAG: adenosylcobinamide-GDP ribazoletransferase [Clostridiales bacterium]|nr:adenosylcobinamide-GDP ribazoletransferase [Clostridiales bacterium]